MLCGFRAWSKRTLLHFSSLLSLGLQDFLMLGICRGLDSVASSVTESGWSRHGSCGWMPLMTPKSGGRSHALDWGRRPGKGMDGAVLLVLLTMRGIYPCFFCCER